MGTRGNHRGGRGHGPAQAAPVAPAPVKFTILSKEYSQLGGIKFSGSENIIEAQQWLKGLEKIFSGLEITDAQKRQLLPGNFRMPRKIGGNQLLLVSRRTPSRGPSLGINSFGFNNVKSSSIFGMLLI